MKAVESRIAKGELRPLSAENLEEDVLGLYEDMMNWDCGHPMDDPIPVTPVTSPTISQA